MTIPPSVSWFVRAGTVLRFVPGRPMAGLRGYLAVSGGFDAPVVLGSRSTSTLAHFGGIAGRALIEGDTLGVLDPHPAPVVSCGAHDLTQGRLYIPTGNSPRFVPYHGKQRALPTALELVHCAEWVLTDSADRMGCRFRSIDGATLPVRNGELVSFGVVRGAIQLPPGGMPVVLGVDHQTTGGYPLLGVVIEADLAILAQLRPGAEVTFVPVMVE